MTRDMICVYHAADIGEADIVVEWLAENGIATQVKDRLAAATLYTPQIVAPKGIEVCVLDAGEKDRATALLKSHSDELKRKRQHAQPGQTIEATCEECGETATFPVQQAGSVQTCPQCRAYLDVPTTPTGSDDREHS